jgi:hypothetical protein
MRRIYNSRLIVIAAAFPLILSGGCKKMNGYNYIISNDRTKPGVVTDVKVQNFKGGAYITYALPKSDNLLYVLAQYKINDALSRETKSSYYSDTVRVDGFAKSQDYDVTLYAVSRAEIKSDPVVVKVHPDTPPYLSVYPTLTIKPDFGGVHVLVANKGAKPIGLVVITPDNNNEMTPAEQVYSDDTTIAFSVRGYDTIPRKFGAYITDQFGNRSDTLFATIKPIFEEEFDKAKFREFRLPSDAPEGYGWDMVNLWNNSGVGTGYHTEPGHGMPQTFTFDMGATGKISRYRIWDRGDIYAFAHGNPKRWALWGSNNPHDDILPADVSVLSPGQQVGSWIFMGYFEAPPKPSGRPSGDNTAEDLAFNAAGFEYNISLDVPPVRYIRFQTLEDFAGGDIVHVMELTFWGNPQ